MQTPAILVINKIQTLGRITVGQLFARGFSDVQFTSSLMEAEEIIKSNDQKFVIILELTPSWNKQAEIDFLKTMQTRYQDKCLLTLCTTEQENSELQPQFQKLGIRDFILQRFDLENFGKDLQIAIKNKTPGAFNNI